MEIIIEELNSLRERRAIVLFAQGNDRFTDTCFEMLGEIEDEIEKLELDLAECKKRTDVMCRVSKSRFVIFRPGPACAAVVESFASEDQATNFVNTEAIHRDMFIKEYVLKEEEL